MTTVADQLGGLSPIEHAKQVCSCGHVRHGHNQEGGACNQCECRTWAAPEHIPAEPCGKPYNGKLRKEHETRYCDLPAGHDGPHSTAPERVVPQDERAITVWICDSCGHWCANSYFDQSNPEWTPRCKTKDGCPRPQMRAVSYVPRANFGQFGPEKLEQTKVEPDALSTHPTVPERWAHHIFPTNAELYGNIPPESTAPEREREAANRAYGTRRSGEPSEYLHRKRANRRECFVAGYLAHAALSTQLEAIACEALGDPIRPEQGYVAQLADNYRDCQLRLIKRR